jgi:hypothetical protein
MKNLIFCRHKLSQVTTLVGFDSDFHNIVSKCEPRNYYPKENGDVTDMHNNVVGHYQDLTLLYPKRSYYLMRGYDNLNMAELKAIADTHNEILIRRVFIDNGFAVEELDDAFENEDIYSLLK